MALGGPVPDDAYQANDDEFGGALAWDDDMFYLCARAECAGLTASNGPRDAGTVLAADKRRKSDVYQPTRS